MKIIKLPFRIKKLILACGADMKGAFALAKGDKAYLFDGFGDLSDIDNFTRYEKAVKGAIKKLGIKPEIVACDMHSGYFSTQFAENYMLSAKHYTLCRIQHHEAHVAGAITDNVIKGNVLGVAFDGTGYGLDGNMWGGEFFIGNIENLKRAAHLDYIEMPGGDMAVKEPWRMAANYMYAAFGKAKGVDKKKWAILKSMIDKKINSPLTSSMGRLFDAVGSIVLGKKEASFEAELPIELEKIADSGIDEYYNFNRTTEIIKGVVSDLEKKVKPTVISAKFHNTIARMILKTAQRFRMKKVALTGGVFQNRLLTRTAKRLLEENGFTVYTHLNVETNDSGIPIGQIAIANKRIVCA